MLHLNLLTCWREPDKMPFKLKWNWWGERTTVHIHVRLKQNKSNPVYWDQCLASHLKSAWERARETGNDTQMISTPTSAHEQDESAWISEHFTALHSISDCGGLWWQTDGQTWWVNRGCRGGWGYLKADFSSLKAACLCFLSSASRFFSSCSWRISASNRFDSLMACTCQRQICIFR